MIEPDLEVSAARPVDDTHCLISSARVEETPVFDHSGHKLGTIHSLMIHKRTGQVAYAVMAFGGFLGIGTRVHPIPWDKLSYDPQLDGYRVEMAREDLAKAPTLHLDDADRPTDHCYAERLYDYYNARRYWDV